MKYSIWLPFFLLLNCFACGEKMNFDGRLIYGGQGIYALEFSNGEFIPIKALPDLSVDEVERIDENSLLVSSFYLNPSEERSKIAIYDIESKTLKPILTGTRGVYIPEYKKIVFYDRKEQLSIADIGGSSESIEVIDTYSNAIPMPVVLISKSEFLYESKRSGAHGVWKYSFELGGAKELVRLRGCSLNYAVWRSTTGELLCSEILENGRLTGEYFLIDLIGGEKQDISFGKGNFWPVSYINSLDAVVLQERAASLLKGELHPVHIYRFAEGSKTKISENNYLSRRVAYIENWVLRSK